MKITKKLEPFSPSDEHWKHPLGLFKERITTNQFRYLLLNIPDPIYQGRLHKWENEYLGAGIYEIYISLSPISHFSEG